MGELVEVLPFKLTMAWKEEAKVHINSLETRGRLKLGRRLAGRPATHHQRVVTIGDSRVHVGSSAKGRSPSDLLDGDMKRGIPDSMGADLAWLTIWAESARMPADEPSRGKTVLRPAVATAEESDILQGRRPLVEKALERFWKLGHWEATEPAPLRRVRFFGKRER